MTFFCALSNIFFPACWNNDGAGFGAACVCTTGSAVGGACAIANSVRLAKVNPASVEATNMLTRLVFIALS